MGKLSKRKTIEGLGGLFIVYEFDFKSNYQRVLQEGIVEMEKS